MSPPFLVALEKTVGALARGAQGLGPLVEECPAVLGERVGALAVAPLGADELFLLECAKQAVEVAHLDAGLAGQLREALEKLVAVRRSLAQKQEQRRLGEPLDPWEDAPVGAVPPPGARPLPHRARRCKTHM